MVNKLYIATTGFARSGKDTFCSIAARILQKNGLKSKQYALADSLKREVEPFLKEMCGVDVWTTDTETKKDIRDFLVWYGTTWWRKRDPDHWIRNVEKTINEDSETVDVVLISDVRYPNEAHWINSKGGYIIHLTKYNKTSTDGGKTWNRVVQGAPNSVEEKNDPIVKGLSNHSIVWEDLNNNGEYKITDEELINNVYLKEQVFKSLKLCFGLSQKLKVM